MLNGTLAQTTGSSVASGLAGAVTSGASQNTYVTAGSSTATGTGTLTVTALATSATLGSAAASTGAGANGVLTVNGVQINLLAADTVATAISKINTATSQTGVVAGGSAGAGPSLTSNSVGTGSNVAVSGSNALLAALGLTTSGTATSLNNSGADATATFAAVNGMANDSGAPVTAMGNVFTTASGMKIDMSAATLGSVGSLSVSVDTGGSVNLQIGANAGQTLGISISKMDASVGGLNVTNLDVSSSSVINNSGATGTLTRIDAAIAPVSNQRATLGAYQNRLEHTISNLGVSQANLTASESRIRDVDMAAEMVNFKTGILQQAGQAILAQANQSSSGVMSLLR